WRSQRWPLIKRTRLGFIWTKRISVWQRLGSGFSRCSLLYHEYLFPTFVDLMRHTSVRLYARLRALRGIEVLLNSSGWSLVMKKAPKKMNALCSVIISVVFMVLTQLAGATQADDTTITITGHTAGATPFISKLTLEVSDTTVLKSIQFAIDPKPGSVTRPLSGTYSRDYLASRAYVNPPEIILPVYGLYAGFQNIVRLTYLFKDGPSKQAVASITTDPFDDPCGYDNPTVLQARTNSTDLSYDYIMVKGSCSNFEP